MTDANDLVPEPEPVPGATFPWVTPAPVSAPELWLPPLVHVQQRRLERRIADVLADARPRDGLRFLREFTDARPKLSYIVVDELVDRVVGLAIASWPRLDTAGRIRLTDGDAGRTITVDVDNLHALLVAHRRWGAAREIVPQEPDFIERDVSIGDTLAGLVTPERRPLEDDELLEPADELPRLAAPIDESRDQVLVLAGIPRSEGFGAVLDVTLDARTAAKVAEYAASAAPLDKARTADQPIVDHVMETGYEAAERAFGREPELDSG